jgi:hypothetical protein
MVAAYRLNIKSDIVLKCYTWKSPFVDIFNEI